jgi:site-specific recombinase XerD
LVQTGMRVAECAALTLGAIELSERSGWIAILDGKGRKQRSVPANGTVRSALADYLAPEWDIPPTVKALAAAWPDQPRDTPLWLGQRGPMTVRSISRTVAELVVPLARRGLIGADTTAHTLRHTFATIYLQDNPGDLVGLASLLGHSSIKTTQIYVQQSDEELHRKVERGRLNAYT